MHFMSWNPFKTVHPKTKNGMCKKKTWRRKMEVENK